MSDYCYCKVHVDYLPGAKSLEKLLAGSWDASLVRADCFENPAAYRYGSVARGDFVNWPCYVEVESNEGVALEDFVSSLQRILNKLSSAGIRAVHLGDFAELM